MQKNGKLTSAGTSFGAIDEKTREKTLIRTRFLTLTSVCVTILQFINKELEHVPGYMEVFKPFIVRECFICDLEPSTGSLSLPN